MKFNFNLFVNIYCNHTISWCVHWSLSLLYFSGMRSLACSALGCPSGNIGRTFGTILAASPPALPWIGFTSCSATTATLALMLPGSRLFSSWKSFLKITWSKMWRVVGEQRIWRTAACSTGEQDFEAVRIASNFHRKF